MESLVRFGPELILLVFAALIIVGDLAGASAGAWLPAISLAGLACSVVWTAGLVAGNHLGTAFSGTLAVDPFSIFFAFLIPAVAAVVVLESVRYADRLRDRLAEYYALVLVIA